MKKSNNKFQISRYSGELLSGDVKKLFTSFDEALEWSDRLSQDPKEIKSVKCVTYKNKRFFLAGGSFPVKDSEPVKKNRYSKNGKKFVEDSKPVKREWYGKNGKKLNVEEI